MEEQKERLRNEDINVSAENAKLIEKSECLELMGRIEAGKIESIAKMQ